MSLADVFTPVSGFKSTIPRSSCQRNARVRPKPSRLRPPPRPPRGGEPDRRLCASVVLVHEGLEHVHRILLRCQLGHASRLSLVGVRSRSTITPACPLSSRS